MLQNFKVSQIKRVASTKNWLDRQRLQLLETLMQTEQEAYYDEEGLFKVLYKNQATIQ